MANNGREVATVPSGQTTSAAVPLAVGATAVGIEIPAIDNGDVTLQISIDGTNYRDVYYDHGAGPIKYVVLTGGDDPAVRDISKAVLGFGGRWLRVICAAQTSGSVDFIITEVLGQ